YVVVVVAVVLVVMHSVVWCIVYVFVGWDFSDGCVQNEEPQLRRMNTKQKNKVDSVWQEMNEEYAQYTSEKHKNAAQTMYQELQGGGALRRRRKRGKMQDVRRC